MQLKRFIGVTALLILTSACTVLPETGGADVVQADFQNEPFLMVNTQILQDNAIVVPEVLSDGPGWVVIHANDDGSPGVVLGYTPVVLGYNVDVHVEIDPDAATPLLFAMLHSDAGQEGVFEFPGADEPVIVNGQVVSKAFPVSDPYFDAFGQPEDIDE